VIAETGAAAAAQLQQQQQEPSALHPAAAAAAAAATAAETNAEVKQCDATEEYVAAALHQLFLGALWCCPINRLWSHDMMTNAD
jgi:hypothetical protein